MDLKKKCLKIIIFTSLFGSLIGVSPRFSIYAASNEVEESNQQVLKYVPKKEELKARYDEFLKELQDNEGYKKITKNFKIKILKLSSFTYKEALDFPVIYFEHKKTGLRGILNFYDYKGSDACYGTNSWIFRDVFDIENPIKSFACAHAVEHLLGIPFLNARAVKKNGFSFGFGPGLDVGSSFAAETTEDRITFSFYEGIDRGNFEFLEKFSKQLVNPRFLDDNGKLFKSEVLSKEHIGDKDFTHSRIINEYIDRSEFSDVGDDNFYKNIESLARSYIPFSDHPKVGSSVWKSLLKCSSKLKISDLKEFYGKFIHPSNSFLFFSLRKDFDSFDRFFDILQNYCGKYERKDFSKYCNLTKEQRFKYLSAFDKKFSFNTTYRKDILDDGQFSPGTFRTYIGEKGKSGKRRSRAHHCKYAGCSVIDLSTIFPNFDSKHWDAFDYSYGLAHLLPDGDELKELTGGWLSTGFGGVYDKFVSLCYLGDDPASFGSQSKIEENIKKILNAVIAKINKMREDEFLNLVAGFGRRGSNNRLLHFNPRYIGSKYIFNGYKYGRSSVFDLPHLFKDSILNSLDLYGVPFSDKIFNFNKQGEIDVSYDTYRSNRKRLKSFLKDIVNGLTKKGAVYTYVAERKKPYDPIDDMNLSKKKKLESKEKFYSKYVQLPLDFKTKDKYVNVMVRAMLQVLTEKLFAVDGRSYFISPVDFDENFSSPLILNMVNTKLREHLESFFKDENAGFKKHLDSFLSNSEEETSDSEDDSDIEYSEFLSTEKISNSRVAFKLVKSSFIEELQSKLKDLDRFKKCCSDFIKKYNEADIAHSDKIDTNVYYDLRFKITSYERDPYNYIYASLIPKEYKEKIKKIKDSSKNFEETIRKLEDEFYGVRRKRASLGEQENIKKQILNIQKDYITNNFSSDYEVLKGCIEKIKAMYTDKITYDKVADALKNVKIGSWEEAQKQLSKKLKEKEESNSRRGGCSHGWLC